MLQLLQPAKKTGAPTADSKPAIEENTPVGPAGGSNPTKIETVTTTATTEKTTKKRKWANALFRIFVSQVWFRGSKSVRIREEGTYETGVEKVAVPSR